METKPNRIELNNGSYMLFDYLNGEFRIAIYERSVSKSATLKEAVSRALKKPHWDPRVNEISDYIQSVGKWDTDKTLN